VTVGVRTATQQDVEPLSRMLARAFRADPFHRWVFPNERAWARGSQRSFAWAMAGELDHGTVFTDEGLRGAAIWRDPGRNSPSFWEQLQTGLPMLPLLGVRSPLVLAGMRRLADAHPKRRHGYLSILGTDPDQQGQGIGSALLHTLIDRCARTAAAAYLEASRPENVPYYERHGFEVIGELQLPRGPTVWRMLHAPCP